MLLHAPMCYHMLPNAITLTAMMFCLTTAQQQWGWLWTVTSERELNEPFFLLSWLAPSVLTQQWKVIHAHWLHGGGYRMGGNRGKYINFKEEGAESWAKTTAKGGVLWRETRYFWWRTHRHLWYMNKEYLCWQMFLTVGLERFVLESVWPSEYSLPKKRCFSSFFLGISGVGDSAIKPIAQLLVSFKHIPWLNMEPANCVLVWWPSPR